MKEQGLLLVEGADGLTRSAVTCISNRVSNLKTCRRPTAFRGLEECWEFSGHTSGHVGRLLLESWYSPKPRQGVRTHVVLRACCGKERHT